MEKLTPSEKFARNFYLEKNKILKDTFSENSNSYVSVMIKKLDLDNNSLRILEKAISQLLTDSFYTILLALDGCASIGESNQEMYTIFDEKGYRISKCGELESEAYSYFYENKIELE